MQQLQAEDDEAIVIHEKKKIQDVLRESQSDFIKKAKKVDPSSKDQVMPIINRRLGGGLASVVKKKIVQKKEEETKKQKNILSDDDSYYDEQEDRSEDDEDETTQIPSSSSRPSTARSDVNHLEMLR